MSSRAFDDPRHFSGVWAAVFTSVLVVLLVTLPLATIALFMRSPWSYLWAALVFSGTVFAVVRTHRISLIVDAGGVTVHNLVRSHYVPWEAIDSVQMTQRSMLGQGPGDLTIQFLLKGGGDVHVLASFEPSGRHEPMLEAIRNYASRWSISVP